MSADAEGTGDASPGSLRSNTFHGPTAAKVGGSGDQINYFGTALPGSEDPGPLGTPLSELTETDALRLQVHAALDAGDSRQLPVLPPYLHRPRFDDRLRREVAAATEGSRMIMVVGRSSTGKTRACWEALKATLPDDWRLWHPLTPERPEAVIEAVRSGRIGPRTVVWLDEVQMYLPLREGQKRGVPEALQALLSSPRSGPVLVLGSLWPEYWDELVSSSGGEPMRLLLESAGVREVRAPDVFVEAELEAGSALLRSDARLMWAVEHAADRRLTQTLGGGPFLVRRYERADPAARAILDAAMDVARLEGVYFLGSREFLRAAAPGYLTTEQREELPEGWFVEALAQVKRTERGIPGPLAEGIGSWFRLADYLEQYGRENRRHLCPPTSFWEALRAKSAENLMFDGVRFAEAAWRRMRWQQAEALYRSAGDDASLEKAARIRWVAGDRHKVERDAVNAAWQGRTGLLWEFARTELTSGDEHVAVSAYRLATELDGPRRLAAEIDVATLDGHVKQFVDLLAEAGDHAVLEEVADRLRYADAWGAVRRCRRVAARLQGIDAERATMRTRKERRAWSAEEDRARAAADDGDTGPLKRLLRERYDDEFPQAFLRGIRAAEELKAWDLIFPWLHEDNGFGVRDGPAFPALVDVLARSTDAKLLKEAALRVASRAKWDEAECLAERAVEIAPSTVYVNTVVEELVLAGRVEAAERLCDQAKASRYLVETRVRLYLRRGNWAEAEELALSLDRWRASTALLPLVDRRRRQGNWTEAERLLRLRADDDSTVAMELVRLLTRQGREPEAAAVLWRMGVQRLEAMSPFARIMLLGPTEEALESLPETTWHSADFYLVLLGWCCELVGDTHRATTLYRHVFGDSIQDCEMENVLSADHIRKWSVMDTDRTVFLEEFARKAGSLRGAERIRDEMRRRGGGDLLPEGDGELGGGTFALEKVPRQLLQRPWKDLSWDEDHIVSLLCCTNDELTPLAGVSVWAGRLFQLHGREDAAEAYYAQALNCGGASSVSALAQAYLDAGDRDGLMALVEWTAGEVSTAPEETRAPSSQGRTVEDRVTFRRDHDALHAVDALVCVLVSAGAEEWAREALRRVRDVLGGGTAWKRVRLRDASNITELLDREGVDTALTMVELLAEFAPYVGYTNMAHDLEIEGDWEHAELLSGLDRYRSEEEVARFSRVRAEHEADDSPEGIERHARAAADAGDAEVLGELALRRIREENDPEEWKLLLSYGLTPEGRTNEEWCPTRPPTGDVRPMDVKTGLLWPRETLWQYFLRPWALLSPSGVSVVLTVWLLFFLFVFLEVPLTPQTEIADTLVWFSFVLGPILLPVLTVDVRKRWRLKWHRALSLAFHGIMWSPAMIWVLVAPAARERRTLCRVIAALTAPFTFVGLGVFVLTHAHVGTVIAFALAVGLLAFGLRVGHAWARSSYGAYFSDLKTYQRT